MSAEQYISAISLEQVFVDKDANTLLFNGYVLFARDTARTEPKIVYTLSGSPPSYTYVPYGAIDPVSGLWQVQLTSAGAFGLALYYFPYDSMGNIDLYFVQVFSVGGTLQFTRAEWPPNVEGSNLNSEVSNNFVPNGQFLLHTDLPASGNFLAGQIRAPITNIAYGGWTFERPSMTNATDFVTFPRFGSTVEDPENSPRYAVEIANTVTSPGDLYKDLRLKFDDVNKFMSTTQDYTYAFSAQSNAGGNLTVQLILIKNFGFGGSATTETVLGTFVIGSSYSIYSSTFIFGDNTGQVIGVNDDDFLQLAIRFPTNQIFDISFDDFILAEGAYTQPAFPPTTNSEFVYRSLAGFEDIPAYDASDLYLPLILSPTGITYDRSQIGFIFTSVVATTPGYLPCDGTQYSTAGSDANGVPYSRLYNALLVPGGNGITLYNTGVNFVKSFNDPTYAGQIDLSTNKGLAVANTADGTAPTGFTFAQVNTGLVTGITCYGQNNSSTILGVVTLAGVAIAQASAGTSGFTVTPLQNFGPTSTLIQYIASIQTIAATGLAGLYFQFSTTTTTFSFWFKVNGAGSAPVIPGTTLVEIDLLSTWLAPEVARAVLGAINGWQQSTITTIAGSAVPASSYFNFTANTTLYYVWYTVNGVGVDPFLNPTDGIEVPILSTDTATAVANKTIGAINSKFFAVPDFRGLFLRGWNNASTVDPGPRLSTVPWLASNLIGTFEFSNNLAHYHSSPDGFAFITDQGSQGTISGADSSNSGSPYTQFAGISESRPINSAVNYVIKY